MRDAVNDPTPASSIAPTTSRQPLRRFQWTAEVVPLALSALEFERARRFLDCDARLAASGTDAAVVDFLCDDAPTAAQQAYKLRIAVLDARQRDALATRPGPSANEEAAHLISLALGG